MKLLLCLVFLSTTSVTLATSLATYNLTFATRRSASGVNSNIIANDLVLNTGNSMNPPIWGAFGAHNALAQSSGAQVTDSSAYVSFTLAPTANGTLFEKITIDFSYQSVMAVAQFVQGQFLLFSSADNFTAQLDSHTTAVTNISNRSIIENISLDASAIGELDEQTEFRIFVNELGIRGGNISQTGHFLDTFTFSGTQVVPEPSSTLLLSLLGILFNIRRNR